MSEKTDPTFPRLSSTDCVHAGEARQKPGNAMTDAIFCTATFTFTDTPAVLEFLNEGTQRGEYGRYGSPSEWVAEEKLAALEGGEQAVLFASGMAAVQTLLMEKLKSGDEVILFDECYHKTRLMLANQFGKFGVVTHKVPACDYDAMESLINERTVLLISESPTNPHQSIVDLERFVDIGRRRGIETMIDATLATPYNVRPLDYGVDYVVHSTTKYLAGHNDVLGGVVIGSNEKVTPVRDLRGTIGNVNSPHNVYLLLRGMKTFALRMARHNENGLATARFLESHPRVQRVYYAGLQSHRDHEVAKRTMRGYGGLVTFLVKDADMNQTSRIVDRMKIPRIGPSLGGVESLIEQPIIMSYKSYTIPQRRALGIPDNMIRLACGIEDADDLIADLAQALAGE